MSSKIIKIKHLKKGNLTNSGEFIKFIKNNQNQIIDFHLKLRMGNLGTYRKFWFNEPNINISDWELRVYF